MMKSAAVSALKATLSACLAIVKAGEEVIVMERGKPIAKLVPLPHRGEKESAHLRSLARAGLVRLGLGKLPSGFWKMRRIKEGGHSGRKKTGSFYLSERQSCQTATAWLCVARLSLPGYSVWELYSGVSSGKSRCTGCLF
ncbi:MAG: hypothetical protein CAF45_004155 [Nitrospira sp. CG24E]|nr:MAG: hypothetical protein CAF45_004155 [Nitrospira sp. CG24E]